MLRDNGTIPSRSRYYTRSMHPEPAVRYRVVIERDEHGMWVAEIPSLPGCVSQGKTRTEAMQNVRDAIGGYVRSVRERGEPIPPGPEEEYLDLP